jgi:hypothetical protein
VHRKKRKGSPSGRELVALSAVTLAACVVAGVLGAPDKWLAAIYTTVVTFGGMIFFFRRRWSSIRFWVIMAGALLIHLALVWLIFGVILRRLDDVDLLVCLPPILLECFLIYHAVRRFLGIKGIR